MLVRYLHQRPGDRSRKTGRKQDGQVSKRDFVKPTLKKEASLVEVTLAGSGLSERDFFLNPL